MAGTRWPERDGQPTASVRSNPKRTEAGDQAIEDAEIRRASPRAFENQQLMFGEERIPR